MEEPGKCKYCANMEVYRAIIALALLASLCLIVFHVDLLLGHIAIDFAKCLEAGAK